MKKKKLSEWLQSVHKGKWRLDTGNGIVIYIEDILFNNMIERAREQEAEYERVLGQYVKALEENQGLDIENTELKCNKHALDDYEKAHELLVEVLPKTAEMWMVEQTQAAVKEIKLDRQEKAELQRFLNGQKQDNRHLRMQIDRLENALSEYEATEAHWNRNCQTFFAIIGVFVWAWIVWQSLAHFPR